MLEKICSDDHFVKKYALENLRETLSLSYPSYILSLVMGSGKTILIGVIIFIEFALSLKTQQDIFLKNALVFAPGKTILGSLKEISCIDIARILPPRLSRMVETNFKITYTQDGQRDISVTPNSNYNIIITNIEKIRIISKQIASPIWAHKKIREDEKENIANRRLQTLGNLHNLGIFSDEAHNTYGQELGAGIKKVRQTINYLADKTDLKIVINTTGTPYFKKRILKDVIFWYGLLEAIEHNILKDIRNNNIYSYNEVGDRDFISHVLEDFFTHYKNIKIYGGHQSKIAIYFPRIEDVKNIKPFIETEIVKYDLQPNAIFEINNKSHEKDKDIFINRINDPQLPYRIFLLVGMGKEGWNCPSLFSCCLARELGNSNNFVLQAATRCLRQIPENDIPARIYLSQKNAQVLDQQLQENYGENIEKIQEHKNKFIEKTVTLIKYDDKLPQLKITRKIKRYIKKEKIIKDIKIAKPVVQQTEAQLIKYDFSKIKRAQLTEQEINTLRERAHETLSLYEAAQKISTIYSVDYFILFSQLEDIFHNKAIPVMEYNAIKKQVESQMDNYEEKEIEQDELLTIIKKEGFQEEICDEGVRVYTTQIIVNKEKLADLLKEKRQYSEDSDLSFHYTPYTFDSRLEANVFDFILNIIHAKKEQIRDFLFIGGITDRSKTDLVFEYKDKAGALRNYTPDFLIIKNNGEFIFIETKGDHLLDGF